ncbi:MAG TPA: NUDIX hydrolase [Streptosporangiaceae bacterium]|nr:NUDIX hydrolase [Streptosporangiaceae bacterium]
MSDAYGPMRLPVPARLAARARQIRDGRLVAPVPRDAATVILLRPGADQPWEPGTSPEPGPSPEMGTSPGAGAGRPRAEVYMLRRRRTMAFAPGAYVFPGGSVDDRDVESGHGWSGPAPAQFAPLLGLPPGPAAALVRAAVRETFEECGVLLAGPSPDAVAAGTSGPSWEADRQALADGALSLAQLLIRRGLVLRADLLIPWSRWITPEAEQRRYDARFFVAALPAGQQARGGTGEADEAAWLRPAGAVEAAAAGRLALLPPTAITLRELAAYPDVPAILAARRRISPRRPRVVLAEGPGDTGDVAARDGEEAAAVLVIPDVEDGE